MGKDKIVSIESNQNPVETSPVSTASKWLVQAALSPYNIDNFTPSEEQAQFLGIAMSNEDASMDSIGVGMVEETDDLIVQCSTEADSREQVVKNVAFAIYQGLKGAGMLNKLDLGQTVIQRPDSAGGGFIDVTESARGFFHLYEASSLELDVHQF